MPTVAELFDAFPSQEAKIAQRRRKDIFDEIVESFTEELDLEAEREYAREWNEVTEGVPVKICIIVDDKEWLENPKTHDELKLYMDFAKERTDVTLSVEIKDNESGWKGSVVWATITLTKISE